MRETLTLHVFLTARCLALTTGCTSPGLCTVLRRCEDQSQTCSDQGACIDVGQTLRSDRDGSFGDIGPILCGTYGETCCHVGTACGGTLSCVADRCQRCTDSAEACCSGPDLRANGAMCAATSSSGLVPGTCSNGVCSRVLDAPTGVVARADSSSAITVSWTAATGAATYTVETSGDAGFGAPTSTSGVVGTMQASPGLSPGRRYFARVRSVAADGQQSAWSAVASVVTAIAAPGTPSVAVSIPGGVRLTSDCCWVDLPTPAGMYYYAQAHAGSSCPAGTSIEYRFQAQYTSPATLYGWTGWMGADAFMTRPNSPWGVRFFAQAHCVGPGATSAESGTGVGCRLSSGGGC